jgi:hypothetical protein
MNNVYEMIYEEMNKKISEVVINEKKCYFYDKTWQIEPVENKSILESFFITYPGLTNEYFDEIFDEIHPY